MKNQIKKHLYHLIILLGFISCTADDDFAGFQSSLRFEYAIELSTICEYNDECPDDVICHYQNGLYHYLIFEWNSKYYDLGWIEGIPNSYFSSDQPYDLNEAEDICDNL